MRVFGLLVALVVALPGIIQAQKPESSAVYYRLEETIDRHEIIIHVTEMVTDKRVDVFSASRVELPPIYLKIAMLPGVAGIEMDRYYVKIKYGAAFEPAEVFPAIIELIKAEVAKDREFVERPPIRYPRAESYAEPAKPPCDLRGLQVRSPVRLLPSSLTAFLFCQKSCYNGIIQGGNSWNG